MSSVIFWKVLSNRQFPLHSLASLRIDWGREVIGVKKNWKLLLICVAIPLAVGGLAAWLTRDSMEIFSSLHKPPLSPPGWLFPVVWTVLYSLMGIASYLVLTSDADPNDIRLALVLYTLQLGMNFVWSILFFNHSMYLAAFVWLVLLWVVILATTVLFYRIVPLAGDLMLPYLFWVAFAGYLNYGIYFLNGTKAKASAFPQRLLFR